MTKVLFKGWKYELQKISLTRLFQKRVGLDLKAAKERTDALLAGEIFILELESAEQAEELVSKATAIGAVCEIMNDND